MNKEYKNRSSLLWEIERIIYELKNNFKISEMPKYLLMENVPSIINKNHINEFEKWKNSLNDLNYESQLYLLNSKDFGSAQNRNRAFLLSVNKYWKQKVNFNFQNIEPTNKNVFLKDILESNPDEKYFLDDLLNKYKLSEFKTTKSNIKRAHLISYTKFNSESYVYNVNGYGPTLTATGANSRIKIFTHDKRIRTLTDLEVFLYMGFTKDDYEKIKKSNLINLNKMIFLCGNSINVNVLEAIFKTLEF